MSKIDEIKKEIPFVNDGYIEGYYSSMPKTKVYEYLEQLRPYIKSKRDELLIELGELSMNTDLWSDFKEDDYDKAIKLIQQIKEQDGQDG